MVWLYRVNFKSKKNKRSGSKQKSRVESESIDIWVTDLPTKWMIDWLTDWQLGWMNAWMNERIFENECNLYTLYNT